MNILGTKEEKPETTENLLGGHLYISPLPLPPTWQEMYIYNPLDFLAINFLRFSLVLLAIACVADMIEG